MITFAWTRGVAEDKQISETHCLIGQARGGLQCIPEHEVILDLRKHTAAFVTSPR